MADADLQVRWLRQLHRWAGVNMLFFWFLMAIAYGAAKQFRVFQLASSITGQVFLSGQVVSVSVGTVNTCVLVACFVLLTWLFHHIESLWAERVLHWIKTGAQWLRWVEYSFSASVMLVAIAMTSGVQDLSTLLVMFGTYHACMLFGGVSEWHLSTRGKDGRWQAWFFYVISCVMFVASWVPVIVSFFVTSFYGIPNGEEVPTFVYIIVFGLLVLQMPFVIVFSVKMYHMWVTPLAPAEFLDEHGYKYECWYIYMSFVAKTVLAWTVFGAAFQQSDVADFPEPSGPYSEWIISAFLVGGLMWIVSAVTYWVDQDQSAIETTSFSASPLVRGTAVLAAAFEIVTICLGIAYMGDVANYGWIAGLALGVHIGCEALFIPAMDKVVRGAGTPGDRRVALYLRLASFVGYGAYVILCMIEIETTSVRVVVIVLGALVLLRLTLVDIFAKSRYAIFAAAPAKN